MKRTSEEIRKAAIEEFEKAEQVKKTGLIKKEQAAMTKILKEFPDAILISFSINGKLVIEIAGEFFETNYTVWADSNEDFDIYPINSLHKFWCIENMTDLGEYWATKDKVPPKPMRPPNIIEVEGGPGVLEVLANCIKDTFKK